MKAKFISTLFIFLFSLPSFADQVVLLRSDEDALQSRVDIIQQAKKEILVEYFSVWDDEISAGGLALLMDAAKRGIKVKMIVDFLSTSIPLPIYTALLEKGRDAQGNLNLEVKFYNEFNGLNVMDLTYRTHAKMLIIDGKTMIIGGRNVGDKYFGYNEKRNFRDIDALVRGPKVNDYRENFLQVWNSKFAKFPTLHESDPEFLESGCNYAEFYDDCLTVQKHAKDMVQKQKDRLSLLLKKLVTNQYAPYLYSNTGKDWFAGAPDYEVISILPYVNPKGPKQDNGIGSELLDLLAEAKSSVDILSPYLIPPEPMLQGFEEALLKKKIEIKVVTNSLKSTDNLFAQAGFKKHRSRLIKMGVELYEFNGPDTAHGKAAVIDGTIGIVGTFNLDPRSTYLNREAAIAIVDKDQKGFAKELESVIEEFRANSLLTGKAGQEQNLELQNKDVSKFKVFFMQLLRGLITVVPPLESQL